MFDIYIMSNFSAAHKLRGYKGKCEELHGHNWKVEVFVSSENLDKIGMVVDFKVLKKALSQVLKKLDHSYINKLPYFRKVNPTSENMAKYIYNSLKPRLKNINLSKVTVWESDTSAASFTRI